MTEGQYFLIRTQDHKDHAIRSILDSVRPDAEKPVAIQIVTDGDNRTKLQNSYLWGWLYKNIVEQLEEAGIQIPLEDGTKYPYDKDILHDIFGRKFRTVGTLVAKNGSEMPLIKSTTKMGKKEFGEYCDNVEKFAHEFWGITIPPSRGIYRDYEDILRGRNES